VTVTPASKPSRIVGQAIVEMLPQLSPAMIVGSDVFTLIGQPTARLTVTKAAVTGSTAKTAGRCSSAASRK
jgi:hypothetical protein